MNQARSAEISRITQRIYRVLAVDPAAALTLAEDLAPAGVLEPDDVLSLRAAVYIDAGADTRDRAKVESGVAILRELLERDPGRLELRYNLANGLSNLAHLTEHPRLQWYLLTSATRREARRLFEEVGSADAPLSLRARAKTNQANLLWYSHRWVEAYEAYREAVALDPSNAVASSGAARLLLHAGRAGLGPRKVLQGLARRYVELARRAFSRPEEYPPTLREVIDQLPDVVQLEAWPQDVTSLDPYAKFVAHHHLALALTIEGLEPSLQRWDSLMMPAITEDISRNPRASGKSGVPPIFAVFNELKADFLAARWTAYQAIEDGAPETGQYADTLDYAVYGVSVSLLLLAQRAAMDILDRTAVAASEYLNLPGTLDSVRFTQRWQRFRKGRPLEPPQWQTDVGAEIRLGNAGVIALAELAEDVAVGGALTAHQASRSRSTHGVVVLHDMGIEPSRESRFVAHEHLTTFTNHAITSLRLARAAILYFALIVACREGRRSTDGPAVALQVPLHHWIRGERA